MLIDIKGIGPKKSALFQKLGIENETDLLGHFPARYEDRRLLNKLSEADLNIKSSFKLTVISKGKLTRVRKGLTIWRILATDGYDQVQIVYYNDKYSPQKLEISEEYVFYGQGEFKKSKYYLYNPIVSKKAEDFLKITPIYPTVNGLSQKDIISAIKIVSSRKKLDDFMPEDFISEHGLLDYKNSIMSIHFPKDFESINKARDRFLYNRIFMVLLAMKFLRESRNKLTSVKIEKNKSIDGFIESLPFELSADQKKVTDEILNDLASEKSMNRLLQGDVGSGKTIVAILAMLNVALEGHQAALIVPLEIVARQHFYNYKDLLESFGLKVEILIGSTSQKEKLDIKDRLKKGEIDLIFGTQALLQENVVFNDLALVVTDEQHRFGVAQRDSLISKGKCPHVLVMSATPIPRTLALSIYGDLDISSIKTLPKGRIPIDTYAVNSSYEKRVFSFIKKQIDLGKQIFVVCPSIEESEELKAESVKEIFDRFNKNGFERYTRLLHGKLKDKERNCIIDDFRKDKFKILISTTVIEVGVDVKNASLILIYSAERFGLAQLHQLRGRVGRSNNKSYCILMCSSNSQSARERMKIMTETTDGYIIAEKDMKIRGSGEVLGRLQSGPSILDTISDERSKEILSWATEDVNRLIEQDKNLDDDKNKMIRVRLGDIISKTIKSNSLN